MLKARVCYKRFGVPLARVGHRCCACAIEAEDHGTSYAEYHRIRLALPQRYSNCMVPAHQAYATLTGLGCGVSRCDLHCGALHQHAATGGRQLIGGGFLPTQDDSMWDSSSAVTRVKCLQTFQLGRDDALPVPLLGMVTLPVVHRYQKQHSTMQHLFTTDQTPSTLQDQESCKSI